MNHSIRWVIQNNLGSSSEIDALFQACLDLGIEAMPVKVTPFSDELPDVPVDKKVIFYGSPRFIANALNAGRWAPCAFWDDELFSFSHWQKRYGDLLLNHDGIVEELGHFLSSKTFVDEDVFFMRPDRDVKEFAGQLMSVKEIRKWVDKLSKLDNEGTVGMATKVVVAAPKTLHHEWRLFLVEGRVVSGSHYRRYGSLEVHPTLPSEVIAFAEEAAGIWQPAKAFVMDVGQVRDSLKIIEINGINSTGFYASDVKTVINAVSKVAATEA